MSAIRISFQYHIIWCDTQYDGKYLNIYQNSIPLIYSFQLNELFIYGKLITEINPRGKKKTKKIINITVL